MSLPRNPATAQAIEQYVAQPSHALLITGAKGIGKGSVALDIAQQLLGSTPTNTGSLKVIDASPISIEHVRDITQYLRLKSTGSNAINRVIIIEHAENMTVEAQNALLKLLEEPPVDTVIILTVSAQALLLPTIVSRLQTLAVSAPAKADLDEYFTAQGHAATEVARAYNMSGGLPGLMSALLTDGTDHPLLAASQSARTVLQSNAFERLCLVDALSKQREQSIELCEMLGQMAAISLKNPGLTEAASKKWRTILTSSHAAADDLRRYTGAKLVLTRLFLAF